MILVDSSVYIAWIRKGVEPRLQLAPWLHSNELACCGVVRAEVLRGIPAPAVKSRLNDFFNVLQEIPTDARLWEEVVELAWTLDREGIVLPLADLVIACCAKKSEATLFTLDRHFLKIPRLSVNLSAP